jgi:hypothetical protein
LLEHPKIVDHHHGAGFDRCTRIDVEVFGAISTTRDDDIVRLDVPRALDIAVDSYLAFELPCQGRAAPKNAYAPAALLVPATPKPPPMLSAQTPLWPTAAERPTIPLWAPVPTIPSPSRLSPEMPLPAPRCRPLTPATSGISATPVTGGNTFGLSSLSEAPFELGLMVGSPSDAVHVKRACRGPATSAFRYGLGRNSETGQCAGFGTASREFVSGCTDPRNKVRLLQNANSRPT